jgi:hypothetical protein
VDDLPSQMFRHDLEKTDVVPEADDVALFELLGTVPHLFEHTDGPFLFYLDRVKFLYLKEK